MDHEERAKTAALDRRRRRLEAQARSLSQDREAPRPGEAPHDDLNDTIEQPGPHPAQWATAGLFVAVAVGSLLLRILYGAGLEQTAALFIGLPAVLGVMLSLAGRPGSALSILLRGVTLFLLLAAVVFHEGVICLVMGAPLYYGVAALVGWAIDQSRRDAAPAFILLILPVIPSALEGTAWEAPRDEWVEVEAVIDATPEQVVEQLASRPVFRHSPPLFLRLGFPRPISASGSGLELGASRVVRFAGGEGAPGSMTLVVTGGGPDHAVFELVSDESHIAHWLSWDRATVRWEPAELPGGGLGTRVWWRLDWTRHLDPFWWFAPWQRYAMGEAAGYLIETTLTPAPLRP